MEKAGCDVVGEPTPGRAALGSPARPCVAARAVACDRVSAFDGGYSQRIAGPYLSGCVQSQQGVGGRNGAPRDTVALSCSGVRRIGRTGADRQLWLGDNKAPLIPPAPPPTKAVMVLTDTPISAICPLADVKSASVGAVRFAMTNGKDISTCVELSALPDPMLPNIS